MHSSVHADRQSCRAGRTEAVSDHLVKARFCRIVRLIVVIVIVFADFQARDSFTDLGELGVVFLRD
jgi:hypothetical protein